VLEGCGRNIGVLTGKDGKALVDCGLTALQPRLLQALNALSGGPITHLSKWIGISTKPTAIPGPTVRRSAPGR